MTLTSAELTAMRSHAGDLLAQTCTIQEPFLTSDGMGTYKTEYSELYTDIDCRLAPTNSLGRIAVDADKVYFHSLWKLHVVTTQKLEVGYRVRIGDDTFEVLGVDDAHQWSILKTAHCVWIEEAAIGLTGVPIGASLPTNPSEGDIFYYTEDDKLYLARDTS